MIFLLDTNVVSELRKLRPHGALVAWYFAHPLSAYGISAVSLLEMQAGAERTRRQDEEKAREIETWINEAAARLKVISLDDLVARETARIIEGKSKDLIIDAMIAATAKVHGLTVATRNTRDFERFGVPVVDPFLFRRQEPPTHLPGSS